MDYHDTMRLIEIACPCKIPVGVRTFFCVELGRNMHTAHAARCRRDMKFRAYWRDAPTGDERIAVAAAAKAKCANLKLAAERLAVEINDPTIVEKTKHITKALTRWALSGFRCRTDEQIAAIYRDHCLRCGFRDPGADACRLCSCKVRTEGIAVRNKLKMATESCPRGKW